MPLTKKGDKIKQAMQKEYGKKEGEKVFYASENKGTIEGVHKSTGKSKGNKKRHSRKGMYGKYRKEKDASVEE